MLFFLNTGQNGACFRVFRRENGAAVLVREYRGVVGADAPRDLHDLLFVHADEGAENGKTRRGVGHADRPHGLRGHLPQTLARDQRLALEFLRHAIGEFHHVAAQQQRKILLVAGLHQFFLDIGQRDHVQVHTAAPASDQRRQIQHFLPRLLACVGHRLEVERLGAHAALGHHPARHGRIDAAREEQQPFAVGADGQPARALELPRVEIGRAVADFHQHRHVGPMHVHPQFGTGRKDRPADGGGDLRRGERKGFVRAFGFHLESFVLREERGQIGLRDREDALHILFRHGGAHHAGDAEHAAGGAERAFQVGGVV